MKHYSDERVQELEEIKRGLIDELVSVKKERDQLLAERDEARAERDHLSGCATGLLEAEARFDRALDLVRKKAAAYETAGWGDVRRYEARALRELEKELSALRIDYE